MIAIISPAKSLDMDSPVQVEKTSSAQLLKHAEELIQTCRTLSASELESLMSISSKLAQLNFERFQEWTPDMSINAKQAVYAFTGDVYQGLSPNTLSPDNITYLQDHLCILSGLYGLLKPLDLIKAYRLEMGTKLNNTRGSNLYQFWGSIITECLNSELEREGSGVIVNLASNEYFKVIKAKELGAKIITPQFKDYKDGKLKMISFFAKKARGMMLRYIVENRIEEIEDLKNFDVEEYRYDESLSKGNELVFTR